VPPGENAAVDGKSRPLSGRAASIRRKPRISMPMAGSFM